MIMVSCRSYVSLGSTNTRRNFSSREKTITIRGLNHLLSRKNSEREERKWNMWNQVEATIPVESSWGFKRYGCDSIQCFEMPRLEPFFFLTPQILYLSYCCFFYVSWRFGVNFFVARCHYVTFRCNTRIQTLTQSIPVETSPSCSCEAA